MPPMQTISARLSSDDLEWLSSLDLPGATTPSDKLRALLQQFRRQHEGSADYGASLAWMRELVAPLMARVGAYEHRSGQHSELVRLMGEWVPQSMAVLLSNETTADSKRSALTLEDQLGARAIQLVNAVLRLAIAPASDVYDPKVLQKHLPAVLALVSRLAADRTLKETADG